jgi:dihydroneopterin aldolase/2-amino-4-hydroxy-6-hydroxymethyldihydropteridine diphosphokinase
MDEINITGIEFYGYHGVLDSEKEKGQKFFIDCSFEVETSLCNDNLNKTVNYAEVTTELVSFAVKNRYDLIETLANNLAKDILLKFNTIKSITITVHKPNAPIPTKFDNVALTVTRGWHTCYLAVGSNLGNREENLDFAWNEINNHKEIVGISKSKYIETKPYGVTDQPDFLNGAIKIKTILTPYELLEFCNSTEVKNGRVRTRRWGERTLDVDILMYDDLVLFTDKLIIPHPEMYKRDFVLKPLTEIEPYLVHPILKSNVLELLKRIEE